LSYTHHVCTKRHVYNLLLLTNIVKDRFLLTYFNMFRHVKVAAAVFLGGDLRFMFRHVLSAEPTCLDWCGCISILGLFKCRQRYPTDLFMQITRHNLMIGTTA